MNLKAAIERSNLRMRKEISVTVKLSLSDLSFLKREMVGNLTKASKLERRKKRRPATKALESLLAYNETDLNTFLVQCGIRNSIHAIVMKQMKELL